MERDDKILTRDDLESTLKRIGVRRYRIIEVRPVRSLIIFVRLKKQEIVFDYLSDRVPAGIGIFVGTLGTWECLIKRRQFHII